MSQKTIAPKTAVASGLVNIGDSFILPEANVYLDNSS